MKNNDMKETITQFIINYTQNHDAEGIIPDIWGIPLVRFGDATLPELDGLKNLVHPEHDTPEAILPGAKTIVAYFLPFREEIGNSNKEGRLASVEWAKAYEKTNAFICQLNDALIAFLAEHNIRAAISEYSYGYDGKLLKSKWSQRHVAYYCGLGTFGMNNMLITEKGCCGRFNTVVTDLEVEHDHRIEEEYCLYKRDGSCGACMKKCPVGAITPHGYDRFLCDRLCSENGAVHVGYCDTPSYQLENTEDELIGSNVCGKCSAGMPCTYHIPKHK